LGAAVPPFQPLCLERGTAPTRVDTPGGGPTLDRSSEGSSGQGAESSLTRRRQPIGVANRVPRKPFEPDPGHTGEGTGHLSMPTSIFLAKLMGPILVLVGVGLPDTRDNPERETRR